MSDAIEVNGRSVEDAVDEALLQLGARRDEVDVEVLDEGKSGLWGILGNRPARVRVTKRPDGTRSSREHASRPGQGVGRPSGEAGRAGRNGGQTGGRTEIRAGAQNDGPGRESANGRGGGRGVGQRRGRGGGRSAHKAGQQRTQGRRPQEGRDAGARAGEQRAGGRRDVERGGDSAAGRGSGRGGGHGGGRGGARGGRGRSAGARELPVAEIPAGGLLGGRESTDAPMWPDAPVSADSLVGIGREAPALPPWESARDPGAAQVDEADPVAPEAAASDGEQTRAVDLVEPLRGVPEGEVPAALEKLTVELMRRSGVPCRCEVRKGEYHLVKIITDEASAGVLIGRHGSTIDAVEHVVERMASQAAGRHVNMNLDINNYRRRREEKLVQRAKALIDHVTSTGEEIHVEPLSARERRIIHMEVAKAPGLQTYTVADAGGKHVVVARADAKRPVAGTMSEDDGGADDGLSGPGLGDEAGAHDGGREKQPGAVPPLDSDAAGV